MTQEAKTHRTHTEPPAERATQTINYNDYEDRVLAGWQGKCLGGVIGAPLENQTQWLGIPVDEIWPETLAPNDDLDIQLVWLEALQERGLHLTHDDLAEFWQDRCWYNFCEYGFFLHNVQRGIHPPLSGTWNNRFFSESEGCPIRAEIWGLVAPGNPELAADLARVDGELDHGGASVQSERFLAACNAEAFIRHELDAVLDAGLRVIPRDSRMAFAVGDVRRICDAHPDPFAAWRMVIREYGDRDASKAITNHALTLMSLFLGRGDFRRTMHICACAGWDTDCTAATAGALLGVMGGSASLPRDWLDRLGKTLVCGIKVPHSNTTLARLADETARIGVEMAATRNRTMTITGSPKVPVRPAPETRLSLRAVYPQGPVLWRDQPTPVQLTLHNPTDTVHTGIVTIEPPANVRVEMDQADVAVAPGDKVTIDITVSRPDHEAPLRDKNLLPTRFMVNSEPAAECIWGLGGARQWRVYGPYWDMWDRTQYAICPYHNKHVKSTPGRAGIQGDTYNNYVRIDHPYLDEARLVEEDIPEEMPFAIECGEDLITAADLGGFMSQGCYYLVRTFRFDGPPRGAQLRMGSTGPYRAWLDGRQVGAEDRIRCWAVQDGAHGIQLTGKPQRLVVKVARLTDAFTFSAIVLGAGDPEQKRGISFMFDTLEDC